MKYRKEGNKFFSNKKYTHAINSYTQGINEKEEDTVNFIK